MDEEEESVSRIPALTHALVHGFRKNSSEHFAAEAIRERKIVRADRVN